MLDPSAFGAPAAPADDDFGDFAGLFLAGRGGLRDGRDLPLVTTTAAFFLLALVAVPLGEVAEGEAAGEAAGGASVGAAVSGEAVGEEAVGAASAAAAAAAGVPGGDAGSDGGADAGPLATSPHASRVWPGRAFSSALALAAFALRAARPAILA